MTTTAGPREVLVAARRARAEVASVVGEAGGAGSVAQWAQVVGELQALVDVATAVQDSAVVALAAVETEVDQDGTLVEVRHVPGHVALDAPAILSGVLCVSAVHAERRVREAVRVAADGPEGTPASTGLGGLHVAMGDGRLDPYRAQVLAHELQEAPAEVARVVVGALEAWFEQEDATRLRRRCRRLLARISPDLLRQRAVRARSESGLRRWVDEPGVDTWLGTFPSEEACTAWAAIDALAQQYVRDGVCDRVDRARARALTDLVTQQASIDVRVTLTATAGESEPPEPDDGRPADLVSVSGATAGEPVFVRRDWLARVVASTTCRTLRTGKVVVVCDPATGALLDPHDALTTDTYRPGAALARFVRARDGHCRFPGCHVSARFCDLDHVRPHPAGPTSAANLVCLCRRHHRIKQRPGWRAVLHPDATMTWTDPTGRVRTTAARDHRPVVLPDRGADRAPPAVRRRGALPDGPHSALEHHLEHHPPPRPWVIEYRPRDGHAGRRCALPTGDPPF